MYIFDPNISHLDHNHSLINKEFIPDAFREGIPEPIKSFVQEVIKNDLQNFSRMEVESLIRVRFEMNTFSWSNRELETLINNTRSKLRGNDIAQLMVILTKEKQKDNDFCYEIIVDGMILILVFVSLFLMT